MLRIGDHEITRTPHIEVAQVVQRPLGLLVAIGLVPTTRARLPAVIATVRDDLGLGQVCGDCDPGAGVGAVFTWTAHRVALLAPRFGPALYAKRLLGTTRCSRYSLLCYHAFMTTEHSVWHTPHSVLEQNISRASSPKVAVICRRDGPRRRSSSNRHSALILWSYYGHIAEQSKGPPPSPASKGGQYE